MRSLQHLPPLLLLGALGALAGLGGCAKGEVLDGLGGSPAAKGTDGTGSAAGGSDGGTAGCGLTSMVAACNTCLDKSCCAEGLACAADPGCGICLGTTTPPVSCNTDAALMTLTTCLAASCNAACGGSSSSSSGGGTLTCTSVDGPVGCCENGELHYCATTSVVNKTCTGGEVCGWNASAGYYDCVSSPGGSDPSGTYPIACQ